MDAIGSSAKRVHLSSNHHCVYKGVRYKLVRRFFVNFIKKTHFSTCADRETLLTDAFV